MNKDITQEELTQLIYLAKKVLWSDEKTRRKIQEHKVNIVPANFYSDIPLVDEIENSFEYRLDNDDLYNFGLFESDRMKAFMSEISVYASEFSPPLESPSCDAHQFFWKNPAFSYSDAMAYYCIIRHFRPNRIIEIGSGYSTIVANQALDKNETGTLILIEPFPKEFLYKLSRIEKIFTSFVQDISVDDFMVLLESSDMLFIDSTHTVKIGSDCLYIYLVLMPRIQKDIIIHSHDIHLPFGMPKKPALEKHIYWTEQYLLFAYLLDNPRAKVLFGSAYSHRKLPEESREMMGGKYQSGGGSIWYRLKSRASL